MKKYIFLIILVTLFSCSDNNKNEEEKIGGFSGELINSGTINNLESDGNDKKDNTFNYVNNIEETLKEAKEQKGIIDDTIEVVEGYGDTLKNSISDAKDIKNMINERYDNLKIVEKDIKDL